MRINRVRHHDVLICLIAILAVFAAMAATQGYAGEASEEKIVAAGDEFVLTQKVVDEYGAFFARQKMRWSPEEVTKTALKYELLAREYQRSNSGQKETENPGDDAAGVAAKIRDGKKYIQKVLDDWKVSDSVIASYYRSNPEKFSTGEAPDGTITVKPLDEEQRNEIRFKIIESKKEVIVKEFVDSLISKYHIKTLSERNIN